MPSYKFWKRKHNNTAKPPGQVDPSHPPLSPLPFPPEILNLIADYLETRHLRKLAQTSRRLRDAYHSIAFPGRNIALELGELRCGCYKHWKNESIAYYNLREEVKCAHMAAMLIRQLENELPKEIPPGKGKATAKANSRSDKGPITTITITVLTNGIGHAVMWRRQGRAGRDNSKKGRSCPYRPCPGGGPERENGNFSELQIGDYPERAARIFKRLEELIKELRLLESVNEIRVLAFPLDQYAEWNRFQFQDGALGLIFPFHRFRLPRTFLPDKIVTIKGKLASRGIQRFVSADLCFKDLDIRPYFPFMFSDQRLFKAQPTVNRMEWLQVIDFSTNFRSLCIVQRRINERLPFSSPQTGQKIPPPHNFLSGKPERESPCGFNLSADDSDLYNIPDNYSYLKKDTEAVYKQSLRRLHLNGVSLHKDLLLKAISFLVPNGEGELILSNVHLRNGEWADLFRELKEWKLVLAVCRLNNLSQSGSDGKTIVPDESLVNQCEKCLIGWVS